MEAARINASVQTHDADTGTWGTSPSFESAEAFARVATTVVELSDDNPKAVAFGDIAGASLVVVEVIGGGSKVRARLTSADGAAQAVPVNPFAMVLSRTVPFTALDLTRVAGSSSTVRVRVALGVPPA